MCGSYDVHMGGGGEGSDQEVRGQTYPSNSSTEYSKKILNCISVQSGPFCVREENGSNQNFC